MATHSSILAWIIPWKETPGRLQSIGWQRVEHKWSDLAHTHTHGYLKSKREKQLLVKRLRNWNAVHFCWWHKMVQSLWKAVWWNLNKLNIKLPYDPAIPLLDKCPKELKAETKTVIFPPVFPSSTIHNSQKSNNLNVHRQMNKQIKCNIYIQCNII